jgi:hypothetical protein
LTRLLPRVLGPRFNALFDNAWSSVTSARMRAEGEAAAAEAVTRLGSR